MYYGNPRDEHILETTHISQIETLVLEKDEHCTSATPLD